MAVGRKVLAIFACSVRAPLMRVGQYFWMAWEKPDMARCCCRMLV